MLHRNRVGPKGLRRAGLAALLSACVIAMVGCGGDFVNITPDAPGILITIKKPYTDALVSYRNGTCATKDWNGDGIVGSSYDRSLCVFDLIRKQGCDTRSGIEYVLCYDFTQAEEWRDSTDAFLSVMHTSNDCIAWHYPSTVDPPFNWTARELGKGGCTN
jgi:hypothetical protein